jgi:hypothetical protein
VQLGTLLHQLKLTPKCLARLASSSWSQIAEILRHSESFFGEHVCALVSAQVQIFLAEIITANVKVERYGVEAADQSVRAGASEVLV